MKKVVKFVSILSLAILFVSCSTVVTPNYYGVLMQNYGKNGKSDYSLQQGRVSTWSMGTELYQLPAFEQRAEFENDDNTKRKLSLKASDNTEFTASPLYSYFKTRRNSLEKA